MSLENIGTVIKDMEWPGQEKTKQDVKIAEICVNCGTIVNFNGDQWRRPCPQCGLVITISRRRTAGSKPVECWACKDTGIIIYQAQYDGLKYDYAARCICKAGISRPEKAIPTIDQVQNAPDYQTIFARNKKKAGATQCPVSEKTTKDSGTQ